MSQLVAKVAPEQSQRRRRLAMSLIFAVGLLPSAAMAWRLIRKASGRSRIGNRLILWRRSLELMSPLHRASNRRVYGLLLAGTGMLFIAPIAYALGSVSTPWEPPVYARHAVGVWVGLTSKGDAVTLRVNRYGTASLENVHGTVCRGPASISGDTLSIRPSSTLLGGHVPVSCTVSQWPASDGVDEMMVVDGMALRRLRKVVPLPVQRERVVAASSDAPVDLEE